MARIQLAVSPQLQVIIQVASCHCPEFLISYDIYPEDNLEAVQSSFNFHSFFHLAIPDSTYLGSARSTCSGSADSGAVSGGWSSVVRSFRCGGEKTNAWADKKNRLKNRLHSKAAHTKKPWQGWQHLSPSWLTGDEFLQSGPVGKANPQDSQDMTVTFVCAHDPTVGRYCHVDPRSCPLVLKH